MPQTFPTSFGDDKAFSTQLSDMANAFSAFRSAFSGATAPSSPSPVAGQFWYDTTDDLLKVYDGTRWRPVHGRLHANTTGVGNVGTGVDDLITWSVPASTLAVDGDVLHVLAWGSFAANGNNKEAKLLFGATTIATTGVTTQSGGTWWIEAHVARDGATAQFARATAILSGASTVSGTLTAPAETLSGAVTLKCTGEGTSDNDVVQEGLVVRLDWRGA